MEKAEAKLELISKYFGHLSSLQLRQLASLDDLYKEWNSRINLISRRDMDKLYPNHILHSLSIAAAFRFDKDDKVIDIGTGGGFPGIPLAIFFPDTAFHLVDSIAKKIKAVEAIAGSLGLTNVTAQQTRAEDIKTRRFDAVVSRGVASLKELWSWSEPLLRTKQHHDRDIGIDNSQPLSANGLICLKGGELETEIARSGCHPRIIEIYPGFSEEYFRKKYILYIQKVSYT